MSDKTELDAIRVEFELAFHASFPDMRLREDHTAIAAKRVAFCMYEAGIGFARRATIQPTATIPDGYKLMPLKLTPKLVDVLEFGRKQPAQNTYLNLLAAAPAAPADAVRDARNEVEAALELAAQTVELFDDATMKADYMLDSGECAGIIRALKPSAIDALKTTKEPA